MRINKRCIQRARKIKAQNSCGKVITKFIHQVYDGITSAFSQLWNAVLSVASWVKDTLTNYVEQKREDKELFKTLPSIRKFEKDMI